MYNTIWRRRSLGLPGAPQFRETLSFAPALIAVIVFLGVLLSFLGSALIATLLVERWVLRYIPSARNFLGLN